MTIRNAFIIGTGIFAVLSRNLLQAADWPQWRGPARDDISTETGLLKQWPAGGPAQAWKATGLGAGLSGVSVAGGRVYTMGDGTDSSYLHALDEATGKLLWSVKVGPIGGGGGFPGPRCTPTVDRDLVFAIGQFGDLVCVEAATGKERWRRNLEKDLSGKMMSGWGYAESPLVDGDKVICTPGGSAGTMVALSRKTGTPVWRTTALTDKASYASAVVATIGGTRQYVQVADQNVVGINPPDGKVLWSAKRFGKTAVAASPVVADNLVFVSSSYGIGCNCFQVDGSNGVFTAKEIYANKEMANQHGGLIQIGDKVFGFSDGKGWTWMDLKTGNVVLAEKGKLGKGSQTFADGLLYLRTEDNKGTVVLLDPASTAWAEKGRFDQPERTDKRSWPHPVVANGRLYLRDQNLLIAYDVKAR